MCSAIGYPAAEEGIIRPLRDFDGRVFTRYPDEQLREENIQIRMGECV